MENDDAHFPTPIPRPRSTNNYWKGWSEGKQRQSSGAHFELITVLVIMNNPSNDTSPDGRPFDKKHYSAELRMMHTDPTPDSLNKGHYVGWMERTEVDKRNSQLRTVREEINIGDGYYFTGQRALPPETDCVKLRIQVTARKGDPCKWDVNRELPEGSKM